MNSQREGLEEVMRVIAGKYKSRQLKAVPTKLTRPTTDKNKENLYNMIGPYFDGGICLDLFAGSGGLGIEALSRGMDELYAVDKQYKAFQVIRENINSLKITNAHVIKADYRKALGTFKEEKEDLARFGSYCDSSHIQERITDIRRELYRLPEMNAYLESYSEFNKMLDEITDIVFDDISDELAKGRIGRSYARYSR